MSKPAKKPPRKPVERLKMPARAPASIKQLARECVDRLQLLEAAAKIAAGDIHEYVGADKDGEPIVGTTKNSDRIAAIKLLLSYAEGLPTQSVQVEGGLSVQITGGGLGLRSPSTD